MEKSRGCSRGHSVNNHSRGGVAEGKSRSTCRAAQSQHSHTTVSAQSQHSLSTVSAHSWYSLLQESWKRKDLSPPAQSAAPCYSSSGAVVQQRRA
eukprot:8011293-Pyramimonas_sp.AAC.1